VKGGRPFPGFSKRHPSLILLACFQNISRGPPTSLRNLGERPGVAFPAREATTGLVNRKVIFRPGEMNRRDQPERAGIRLLERGLAGHHFFPFNLCKTTPLWVSLFN